MAPEPDDTGRFSDPGLLILASLSAGPKHGYAMMEDIAAFSGTRLEPGTLYGALARLEHGGWVEALAADDRRRPYRLTGLGQTTLDARLATLERIVRAGRTRMHATNSRGTR
ncbi:MAG TPA: helix-turn-helix transcriptional regulator [Candidatus Saccharimonadales bacterium]|nr:helix-turn-helix transcriptional regulator [Candidatus Saccharimonadales bacterium]